MPSKKGVLSTQMLFYAFAIVIAALIIFWGYKSMTTFSSSGQESQLLVFKSKMVSDMETLSLKKNTVKQFSYKIPSDYDTFCVFDIYNNSNLEAAILDFYPIIKDDLETKSENIFLLGKDKVYSFKAESLRIKSYPFYQCTDIKNGQTSFSAKGTVIDSEPFSLMLTGNKAEKNISLFSNNIVHGDGYSWYTLASDVELFSTDGFLLLKMNAGSRVKLPGNDSILSIEVVRPGEAGETYDFQPAGAVFGISPAKLYVKVKECSNPFIYQFRINTTTHTGSLCVDEFVVFNISSI